ncbi:MAG: M48 family metallopeptidase [Pseudomonadota bacterium]
MKISIGKLFGARVLAAALAFIVAPSCAYNETLGRNQLLFVSQGQMAQLASSAWTSIKQQEPISTDPAYTARVNRVAPRIIRAAGGNPNEWEVRVFASDQLNAFALPGGKIGIYTGILDIMENDDQVAAVIGHEVAHVNFNHSGERYSQATAAQVGLGAASAAVGGGQSGAAAMQALGLGVQVGALLPFSRKHELEADKFGVRYMHRAGYNANEAIRFWQKMSAQKQGGGPPEFLATHPADATRIAALRAEIALLN